MALIDEDGYSFDIEEWWDHYGIHHPGEPSLDELLDQARELTGHIVWTDGREQYFDLQSEIGWTWDELVSSVDDAEEGYGSE